MFIYTFVGDVNSWARFTHENNNKPSINNKLVGNFTTCIKIVGGDSFKPVT